MPLRRTRRSQGIGLALFALLASDAARACWDEAAARYGVDSRLLYAIARVESKLDPRAVGRNRDGSRDIGLMQINSSWLPKLAAHGIPEQRLFDACTSIEVGAWILASNFRRMGYTWEAVGAYNARNPLRRQAYARRVHRELLATTGESSALQLPARKTMDAPSSARQTPTAPGSGARQFDPRQERTDLRSLSLNP
jgi:soluble lytic murein transglycosylase-like protein